MIIPEETQAKSLAERGDEMKRKRKVPLAIKILLIILALLVLTAGILYGYVFYKVGSIEKVDTSQEERIDPSKESFETDEDIPENVTEMEESQITWEGADPDVMKDKEVVNILLIGQDRREGESRQRSDSMILVTINKETKKLSMTSFMRDLYVQIPGYSDNRLNAAYAFGGMSLLDETLQKNFGISVDGNVEVDFEGFVGCIDTLGGVDITLNQAEAAYLNDPSLKEGANHLNGEQALRYSRIRSVGNADYERTERQRRVLTAVFDKFKNADIATIMNTVNSLIPYLTTDMSTSQILGYALEVFQTGARSVESYRVPVDGGYTPAVIRGMMVLVPDLKVNQDYLKNQLYGN